MKIFALLFLLTLTCSISAQEVFFSESHDKDGHPIVSHELWEMKPWGVGVEILYNNGEDEEGEKINIKHKTLYMYIDKEEEGEFQPYDSKAISANLRKNWVVYKYDFTEVGKYKVYFSSSEQNILAEKIITIRLAERFSPEKLAALRPYYFDCRMYLCDWVIDEKPINIKHEVSRSDNRGQVVIYLKMDKPLNVDTLVVDVWKQNPETLEFDKFIRTKKYIMKPDWHDTFFKYRFGGTGRYKMSIYNERSELVKEREIEVVQ